MKKSEYALISNEAKEKGIGFGYREKGADNHDSGWRFFSSPRDYSTCGELSKIKKRELTEVESILGAGRGSIYRKTHKGWKKTSRDNSLKELPNITP